MSVPPVPGSIHSSQQALGSLFHPHPPANPLAIDLLLRLLNLDPAKRVICEYALNNPYLQAWHNAVDEFWFGGEGLRPDEFAFHPQPNVVFL